MISEREILREIEEKMNLESSVSANPSEIDLAAALKEASLSDSCEIDL